MKSAFRLSRGAAFLLALGLVGEIQRPASAAGADDKDTAKLVVQMISRFHLSRPLVDDKASSKLLDLYLKHLDIQKLYFLQADIDEFGKHRTTLDDELKAGDTQFGYVVFNRYKDRMKAQIAVANKWIDADHHFTLH